MILAHKQKFEHIHRGIFGSIIGKYTEAFLETLTGPYTRGVSFEIQI